MVKKIPWYWWERARGNWKLICWRRLNGGNWEFISSNFSLRYFKWKVLFGIAAVCFAIREQNQEKKKTFLNDLEIYFSSVCNLLCFSAKTFFPFFLLPLHGGNKNWNKLTQKKSLLSFQYQQNCKNSAQGLSFPFTLKLHRSSSKQ